MGDWANAADVTTLTGRTATEADVAMAEATLATLHGLIPGVVRTITNRDRYWLKLATAYQAAWAVANPDLFERLDVTSASQDGQSANFKPDALVVAPLARRALKRLSWRGTRTIGPTPLGRVLNVNDDDWEDTHLAWRSV
jgi:hypothetical protein